MSNIVYMNNTSSDVSAFHAAIIDAIANGGIFKDEFADIFKLTKTPAGSSAEYILDWK